MIRWHRLNDPTKAGRPDCGLFLITHLHRWGIIDAETCECLRRWGLETLEQVAVFSRDELEFLTDLSPAKTAVLIRFAGAHGLHLPPPREVDPETGEKVGPIRAIGLRAAENSDVLNDPRRRF